MGSTFQDQEKVKEERKKNTDQGYRCSVLDIDETVITDRDGIL